MSLTLSEQSIRHNYLYIFSHRFTAIRDYCFVLSSFLCFICLHTILFILHFNICLLIAIMIHLFISLHFHDYHYIISFYVIIFIYFKEPFLRDISYVTMLISFIFAASPYAAAAFSYMIFCPLYYFFRFCQSLHIITTVSSTPFVTLFSPAFALFHHFSLRAISFLFIAFFPLARFFIWWYDTYIDIVCLRRMMPRRRAIADGLLPSRWYFLPRRRLLHRYFDVIIVSFISRAFDVCRCFTYW